MGWKKKVRPPLDAVPPSGVFLRTPTGRVYMSKGGKRYEIAEVPLASWNANVLPVTEMAIRTLEDGGKLGFRDGTLVKDFSDGRIYLISDSRRRLITNPDLFEQLGGDEAMMVVPSEYIKLHREGEEL
jgi:hypothetical protein